MHIIFLHWTTFLQTFMSKLVVVTSKNIFIRERKKKKHSRGYCVCLQLLAKIKSTFWKKEANIEIASSGQLKCQGIQPACSMNVSCFLHESITPKPKQSTQYKSTYT